MDMSGETKYKPERVAPGSNSSHTIVVRPRCIIKGCLGRSEKLICDDHLKNTQQDKLKFSDSIIVNPTVFAQKTKNPANQLGKPSKKRKYFGVFQMQCDHWCRYTEF
jgi:hypothetical protein